MSDDTQLWTQGGFAVALALTIVACRFLWTALRDERAGRDAERKSDRDTIVALATKSAEAHHVTADAIDRLRQEVEDARTEYADRRRNR